MGRKSCNVTPLFLGVQHFYRYKMLIVACRYVTRTKKISKTETETNDA